MQKPPYPQGGGWPDDRQDTNDVRNARASGNPFGRAFHGPAGAAPTGGAPSSSRLEPELGAVDEELPGRLPAGFGNLARRVAKTNLLVDRAISSITAEQGQPQSAETLSELGENLNLLFSQLYEASADSGASPWHTITDSLSDLSARIERREQLRAELQMTQHAIDKAKSRLIDQIQEAARVEQERLSLTRMRSRLAAVMADKLLNKLR